MMPLSLARFVCALFIAVAVFGASLAFGAGPFPQVNVEIADVGKSKELASVLSSKGFKTTIPSKNMRVTDVQTNCAVWIGKNVPLEALRVVLPEAIRTHPELKFFHVVGDRGETPPAKVNDTVHIGGSIEATLIWKLNVIDQKELLNALATAKSLKELHAFLHEKNIAKEEKTEVKAEPAK